MKKTFVYILADGKAYTFSERFKDDCGFEAQQDAVRAQKVQFILKHVPEGEERLSLLLQQMNKIYSPAEITIYVAGNINEIKKIAYNSFKVANGSISFDEFDKLADSAAARSIAELVFEIEKPALFTDADICEALGIKQTKLNQWKEEQPVVYNYMARNLKKKGA